jgi:hypothetical protein
MASETLQFAGSSAKKTGISERGDHLAVSCAPRQPRCHLVRGVDVIAESIERIQQIASELVRQRQLDYEQVLKIIQSAA